MEMKLSLDYTVRDADRPAWPTNRAITDFLIRNGVAAHFSGGMKSRGDQRTSGRIYNALAKAMDKEADTVELTVDQMRWIYDNIKEWDLRIDGMGSARIFLSPWFIELTDYLESALNQTEKKDEKKAAPALNS